MSKPSRQSKAGRTVAPEVLPAKAVEREAAFQKVVEMIESGRARAFQAGDYSGQLTGSVTLTGFGTCGTWG